MTMHVLTWNLWWRFGPWRERQPAIEAELASCAPDVACFQEVWAIDGDDQMDRITSATGLRHVARSRTAEGVPFRFGNAVASRWPLTDLGTIRLPSADGRPGHRSAVMATVATPLGEVLVVSTHLAWQYDRSALRRQQLGLVVDVAVKQHGSLNARVPVDRQLPMILCGDLNATPDSDEIRHLTGVAPPYRSGTIFTDVWAAVGDGDGHTWTRRNPHTPDAVWPRRRLDYVAVSWPRPDRTLNPQSVDLVGVEAHAGMVPSDHYGVLAVLDERGPEA
ncbi:MAG: endonuclease/exonuclease/phosphatase family protein [Acidimicrobiales bacterium]